jgi:hypothetical protein
VGAIVMSSIMSFDANSILSVLDLANLLIQVNFVVVHQILEHMRQASLIGNEVLTCFTVGFITNVVDVA